jgi:threonine dehydrogenase-like Zn-dependent dehydrogenase
MPEFDRFHARLAELYSHQGRSSPPSADADVIRRRHPSRNVNLCAEGVARIKDMTDGLGAHSVIEAVGTQESMLQAIRSTRPGGHIGFVGVTHGVELPGLELFFAEVHLLGGLAPVRRYLPELIDLIWNRKISPGKVFDLTLPLDQVAEGYRAMDERRAIKTLLLPQAA